MKLEITLADLDTEVGIRAGSRALQLLLAMLPEDAAEFAVRQWLQASAAADGGETPIRPPGPVRQPSPPPAPPPSPPPAAQQQPAAEPVEPDRVAAMFARVAASVPSPAVPAASVPRETSQHIYGQAPYERFRYNDRDFAVRKRGPTAARDQAFADLLSVTTRADLDRMAHKITGLAGIFREIEREDLSTLMLEALQRRQDDLGPSEPAAPAASSEPAPAAPAAVQSAPIPAHTVEILPPALAPSTAAEAPPAEPPAEGVATGPQVEWDGKWVRPEIARIVCLRAITRCTRLVELEPLAGKAKQLAERFDELGLAFGQEIARTLEAQLTALTQIAEPAAAVASTNGAGPDEALRELMRKVEHELGRRFAQNLLKKYNAVQIADLTPDGMAAIRQEAERELAAATE